MTASKSINLPRRLESVQALRGIAALLVLFFHLAEFQRQMAGKDNPDIALVSGLWDRGWVGVDLFFVISGFIMVYVTRNSGNSFKDVRQFIVSRITRIYPLWWVCAGIMAGYFWVSYGMLAAPDRVSGAEQAFTYAAKSFLLIPQSAPPLLGLGWTLIYEMFFYSVFAGLLFLPRKYLHVALGVWAAVTVVLTQFIVSAAYARNVLELISSPLTLEFIAGGLLGLCVVKGWIFKPKVFLSIGVTLSFLGLIIFPYLTLETHVTARVTIFLIPFLCLLYGWVACELKGTLRPPKWLSHLGDWSYSLYLTHYIVLITLRRIYRHFAPESLNVGTIGIWDNIIFAFLTLLISILTASVFYRFIERPSLRFVKSRRA